MLESEMPYLYSHFPWKFYSDKVRLWAIGATPDQCYEVGNTASNLLPKSVWIPVAKTFGPKAELEGRNGPLSEVANVRPR
jgi:hypothetical protein